MRFNVLSPKKNHKISVSIKRRMVMIDIKNQEEIPVLEDFAAYIRNPVFMQFCSEIKKKYRCNEKIEFSRCSWERGWNVKFKKSGKSLCTVYPREGYFTVSAK